MGLLLLAVAILYQARPAVINDPVVGVITRIRYNPEPPASYSLWPWESYETLHPAIAKLKPEDEQSIESVAAYIAQQESDPYLQVKAIHDYVVSRVTYDLAILETGVWSEQDAETVFATGKAVCEGYSNLFQALGKAMGLEVVYLRGKIRRDLAPLDLIPETVRFLESDYDWTNHAWNAVKIEDNWQLVDTTWDGGNPEAVEDSYRADYLMPPPEVMIASHLPRQRDWQLLATTASSRAFEQQPILTPDFFEDQLEIISPSQYQTVVKGKALIEIKSPPDYTKGIVAIFAQRQASKYLLWDLPSANPFTQEDGPAKQLCQSQLSVEGNFMITCEFPEAGDYQVLVYAHEQTLNSEGLSFTPIGQFRFDAARGTIAAEEA
ncbi:MAG: transglutaminase domain-containing protein [Cyanobacteria bacterium J06559_3]